jgi:hypothetical protein
MNEERILEIESKIDRFLEDRFSGIHCHVVIEPVDKKVTVVIYDYYVDSYYYVGSDDSTSTIASMEFRNDESFLQEISTCVKMYLLFKANRK